MKPDGWWWRALRVMAFWSLAIVQPLLDLLSRHGDFLVAHDLRAGDILMLVGALCLLGPAILLTIEAGLGAISHRAGWIAHGSSLGLLAALVALQALKHVGSPAPFVTITMAAAAGLGVAVGVLRVAGIRWFGNFLAPAIGLLPALFLLRPPVSGLLFEATPTVLGPEALRQAPPVVVLVFDELPLSSLLDGEGGINFHRYPAFASFARRASWFRNATTVAQNTTYALPAILTGDYPDRHRVATTSDYPDNLFTWLAGSYRLNVFETLTRLCPEELCRGSFEGSRAERVGETFRDLAVVYLHVVVPPAWTVELPDVSLSWRGFGTEQAGGRGRPRRGDVAEVFRRFVESIDSTPGPTLHFLHLNVPHLPWKYLPSGKEYGPIGMPLRPHGLLGETWGENQWEIVQGFQRHLLQVGYADRLLGELLRRLEEVGLYDPSLIIVTSDHGASFRPTSHRREVSRTNYADVLWVPLFLKLPHQQEAVVSDQEVELVDILPTVADVLGADPSWPLDGRSLLEPSASERRARIVFAKHSDGELEKMVFPGGPRPPSGTVEWKLRLFGSGEDPGSIFRIGPYPELVGRADAELVGPDKMGIRADLDDAWAFAEVDLESKFVPVHVAGSLDVAGGRTEPMQLAVAVNGVVEAVTESFRAPGGRWHFTAMTPESAFHDGGNRVELFFIQGRGENLALRPIRQEAAVRYSLVAGPGGEARELEDSSGRRFQVVEGALRGKVLHKGVLLSGWAADLVRGRLPEAVVLFVDGEFVWSGTVGEPREEVARATGRPELGRCGFQFVSPDARLGDPQSSEVQFFAVLDGMASELYYGRQVRPESSARYALEGSRKGQDEVLLAADGQRIPVAAGEIDGWVETAEIADGRLWLTGWAADRRFLEEISAVVAVVGGRATFNGRTGMPRRDVATIFGDLFLDSGFRIGLPRSMVEGEPSSRIRVFAVSRRGVASELRYAPGFRLQP